MKKRILSVIMVMVMIVGAFDFTAVKVGAATVVTLVTQDEAIEWLRALVKAGKKVSAPNGGYAGECASLAAQYYKKLTGKVFWGHGYQYASAVHSTDLGWSKGSISSGTALQKGDVIVYPKGGLHGMSKEYGHVAIYISGSTSSATLIHQGNNLTGGVPEELGKYNLVGCQYVRPVWKGAPPTPTTYTITFNANGGTGAPANQTKTHDKALTLSSTLPTRKDYLFVGWGSSATATSPVNQPGGTYTGNANYTYYAIWKKIEIPSAFKDVTSQFGDKTISFKSAANGKYIMADLGAKGVPVCAQATGIESWEKFKTEMTTDGYIAFKNISNNKYITADVVSKPAYLYATADKLQGWECFKIYTDGTYYFLRSAANGCWIMADIGVSANTPLSASAAVPQWWESFSIIVEAPPTYTVTFNANGGTGAPANQTKTHNKALTLSSVIPTRSGYVFGGWGSSATATSPVNQPGGTYTGNANYTYYAIWTPITPRPSTSANIPNGVYIIQNKGSGKYISTSSSKNNGVGSYIYQPGAGNGVFGEDQKFQLQRQSDNTYSITSVHSNKVLDVYDGNMYASAKIVQWEWVGGNNQRWFIVDCGGGYYKFICKHSGLAIDVEGGGSVNGTAIQQHYDNGTDAQRFKLTAYQSTNPPISPNPAASFKSGDIDGINDITIFDALEILKNLVGMPCLIETDNRSRNAALITENACISGTPTIFDALEILKYLVNMPSLVK